jgi:hypothetical protein
MIDLDRRDAHLLLAAVRVLEHRHGRPPRPDEVAELLDWPDATVRLRASRLEDLGALRLVQSAYETHLEIRDHLAVESLAEAPLEALAEDLADFDRRKQAEAQKMEQLFADGTFTRERQARLDRMDAGLKQRPARPRNPFDDGDRD